MCNKFASNTLLLWSFQFVSNQVFLLDDSIFYLSIKNLICRELKTCFCWQVPRLCYPAPPWLGVGVMPGPGQLAALAGVSSGGAGAGPGCWGCCWSIAGTDHMSEPGLGGVRLASSGISGSSLQPWLWRISEGGDVRANTWPGVRTEMECWVLGVSCERWAPVAWPVTSPDLNQPVPWPATCSVLRVRELGLGITTHGVSKCWDENLKWRVTE